MKKYSIMISYTTLSPHTRYNNKDNTLADNINHSRQVLQQILYMQTM